MFFYNVFFSFVVSSGQTKQISQSFHLILHGLSLDHSCYDNSVAVPSLLEGKKNPDSKYTEQMEAWSFLSLWAMAWFFWTTKLKASFF